MLRFILAQNLTDEVTDVVTDNVTFWSWDTIVKYFEDSFPTVLDFLVKLVIAIIVLFVGRKVIKLVRKFIRKFLNKTNWDEGGIQFLDNMCNVGLHFVLIMLVLGKFGITASSVIAVIGSVGLSVGLALQGTLSNFAGGVLILLLKPFVVGDYILDNASSEEGTVKEITIFYAKLLTIDNNLILIPNGSLSNSSITNYSHMDMRRIDLTVGVGYASDLSKVKAVLEGVVKTETAVIKDEPVDIFVSDLGDSAVDMGIRVWVKTEDYWPVRWRLLEQMKNALDENGISIPFPQMDVSIRKE